VYKQVPDVSSTWFAVSIVAHDNSI
jgi:hypothetical protein